jgi:hypothetical protein
MFGCLVSVLSIMIGMELLEQKQLSGSEFVTLIIAFSVVGLIISMVSEIQEFSVAGNIVKLKEVKKDAEDSIIELKKARTENFKFLLKLAMRFPGGFGSGGTVDSRLSDFWLLHEQIKAFGCEQELTNDIKSVIKILLGGQLNSISQNSDDVEIKFPRGSIPEPNELIIIALENNSVDKAAKRNVCAGNADKIKESLVIGLDEYKKLYQLYKKQI